MKRKGEKDKKMADVTKGYEDFINGKKVNSNGKEIFDKTLKKSIKKVKQHGSK